MRDTLTLDEVALSGSQRFFCYANQLVAFRIYRADHVKSAKSESHMRHAKPLPLWLSGLAGSLSDRRFLLAFGPNSKLVSENRIVTLDLSLQVLGHDQTTVRRKPRLLSENDACDISDELADWPKDQQMGHAHRAPYHPHAQGMTERRR